jgi:hypothetical protein
MSSLKKLCYENIATSVANAPPHLQEMIIGETTEVIEERVRGQIYQETRVEIEGMVTEKVVITISQLYQDLIPEIVTDIVRATVTGRPRKNFREIYYTTHTSLIEMAIDAAETIAKSCMLDRLETGGETWDIDYD